MHHSYDSPPPEAHLLKSPSCKFTAVTISPRHRFIIFSLILSLQLLLIYSSRSFTRLHHSPPSSSSTALPSPAPSDECASSRIFVYDLPPIFNQDLISNCHTLNPWKSRCHALSNHGFGRNSTDLSGIVPSDLLSSWFATDQFAAELIYHNRMLNYKCRTSNPSTADAFYIPFYAGLAVGKHLWSSNSTSGERDHACRMLLDFLKTQTPFTNLNGHNHFIMLGRITWDFRRSKDEDWGGSFLYMPEMANVTRLLIERNPWDLHDVGVPYPTGFHPKSASEIRLWQSFVLNHTRSALYSFAGAARSAFKNDFRALLIDECGHGNKTCRLVDCGGGRCGNRSRETLGLFLDSDFCLQPRGDSFTRRSMFDCMAAGAIPVLFWKRSAYVQYEWYLPGGEGGEWSVYIDRREVREGKVKVRDVLESVGEARVRRMREKVVELIPRLVYGGAENGIGGGVKDAFDVAVEGVLARFRDRTMGNGR